MKIFTPVYFNNNTLIPIFNTLGEKNIGLQVNYLNIFPKFVYLPWFRNKTIKKPSIALWVNKMIFKMRVGEKKI